MSEEDKNLDVGSDDRIKTELNKGSIYRNECMVLISIAWNMA